MIIYDLREYKKLSQKAYANEKYRLQVELVKLQQDVINNKRKIAVIFEGRDSAGKTAAIKQFSENLIPDKISYVHLGVPTKAESKNWFHRYEKKIPKPGEIVFFDRSWYSRALIEPTLGFCSQRQYKNFMNRVNTWEEELMDDKVELVKFYLSIDKESQKHRLKSRKDSPIKYWKFSDTDSQIVNKFDVFKLYKEQMFERTSTIKAPWVVINAHNKRLARISSMHYLINKLEYNKKKVLKPRNLDNESRHYQFIYEGEVFENLNYNQYKILSKYLG